MTDDAAVMKSAEISACGQYRYRLTRSWNGGGPLLPFIMLNPSTADGLNDDPTIRRCMGFARRDGYRGIVVVNIYAFRATDPKELWGTRDAYGPDNEVVLAGTAKAAADGNVPLVCAWGAHGGRNDRHINQILQFGANLQCLGVTKAGHPRHPLYVRADQPLVSFR